MNSHGNSPALYLSFSGKALNETILCACLVDSYYEKNTILSQYINIRTVFHYKYLTMSGNLNVLLYEQVKVPIFMILPSHCNPLSVDLPTLRSCFWATEKGAASILCIFWAASLGTAGKEVRKCGLFQQWFLRSLPYVVVHNIAFWKGHIICGNVSVWKNGKIFS